MDDKASKGKGPGSHKDPPRRVPSALIRALIPLFSRRNTEQTVTAPLWKDYSNPNNTRSLCLSNPTTTSSPTNVTGVE
jgi:hypothetical protein